MVSIPQPVPGDVALEQELQVLEKLRSKPCFRIGCSEIDDYVLLGGLEAGTVVGLSAEDEEFGLLFGFQVMAKSLLKPLNMSKELPRVAVVTTLATQTLLPIMKNVFKAHVQAVYPEPNKTVSLIKSAFEAIDISRVFDIKGLREILNDIDPQTLGENGTRQKREEEMEKEEEEEAGGIVPESKSTQRADVRVPTRNSPSPKKEEESSPKTPLAEEPSPRCTLPPLRPTTTPVTPLAGRGRKDVIADSEDEEAFTPIAMPLPSLACPFPHPRASLSSSSSTSSSLSPPPTQSPKRPTWFEITPGTKARALNPELRSPPGKASASLVKSPPEAEGHRLSGSLIRRASPSPLQGPTAGGQVLSSSPNASPVEPNPSPTVPRNQERQLENAIFSAHPTAVTKLGNPLPPPRKSSPKLAIPKLKPLLPSKPPPPCPSFLLITSLPTLLSSHLIRHHSRRAVAHAELADLSLHLRSLAREQGMLIMLLNCTTVPHCSRPPRQQRDPPLQKSSSDSGTGYARGILPPAGEPATTTTTAESHAQWEARGSKDLESIFSHPGAMRQHRPAYGNVFASLVNLHLLCTRVARRKADVDLMDAGAAGARLVWVVEVLADDNGVVGAAPQRVGDGEATAEAKGTPDGDRDGEGTRRRQRIRRE